MTLDKDLGLFSDGDDDPIANIDWIETLRLDTDNVESGPLQSTRLEDDIKEYKPSSSGLNTNKGSLDIGEEQLHQLSSSQLIDLVIVHYHQTRPNTRTINGVRVSDRSSYSFDRVYEILRPDLGNMGKDYLNLICLKDSDKRVSGYEVRRLRNFLTLRNIRDLSGITKAFKVSRGIASRFFGLGILEDAYTTFGRPSHLSLERLLGLIQPRMDKEQYRHVTELKKAKITQKKRMLGYLNNYGSPEEDAYESLLEIATDPNPEFVRAADFSLVAGEDYNFYIDMDSPPYDAKNVRSIGLTSLIKNPTRPKKLSSSNLEKFEKAVNPNDMVRCYQAKACAPELEIDKKVNGKNGADIKRRLGMLGIDVMIFDEKTVNIPGIDDIAGYDEADLREISAYARPLIKKYGPLVTLSRIRKLLGDANFSRREFYKVFKKERIPTAVAGGFTFYSFFHVIAHYQQVFRER